MFDAHCHLQDRRIRPCAREVLLRASAAGVWGLLLAGVDPADWVDQQSIAEVGRAATQEGLCIPLVFHSYGIHPQTIAKLSPPLAGQALSTLSNQLAGKGPNALRRPAAIGEIGLDGLPANRASLPLQEELFRLQLRLAREHDLPVVLHILRTHDRALRILKEEGLPHRGGMVHSYSGSADLVPAYLRLGLLISFAGPITYSNARIALLAARAVPKDFLLAETDAPDQTPENHRPARNEPAFLGTVVDALAHARLEDRQETANLTQANAARLLATIGQSPRMYVY